MPLALVMSSQGGGKEEVVMPILSIYFPEDFGVDSLAGRTHRLVMPRPDGGEASEYVIGRAADVDLTLAVKNISRRHCALSYSYAADRWALQDLESMGGTWLNSQRLEPFDWAPLAIGDRIHLSSNPPLCIVEDENDTINGDDDGPATVVSLTPLATAPPPPADGDRYDDALVIAVQWLTGGSTAAGKIARFVLIVILSALAFAALALIVIH
jgi:hypothetical protein